ncbi:MAG: PKD domain-containing protein [Flavobacteriales bacterium]
MILQSVCKIVAVENSVTSIIPNPSFEKYNTCPSSWSQLDYSDTWYQATSATSDYFNSCGYLPSWIATPLPDGKGCVGAHCASGYMEYIGTNLLQPMHAGTKYTIKFNVSASRPDGTLSSHVTANDLSPIDVTIFGYTSSATFPINTLDCPASMGWVELGKVSYSPSDQWKTITLSFTPAADIYSIMLGGPCAMPSSYPLLGSSNLFYFIFDNLVLNKDDFFKSKNFLEVKGSFCNGDLELMAHPNQKNGIYQWYKNGVALSGETDTILSVSSKNYGIGKYSFRLSFNDPKILCSVSEYNVVPEKVDVDFNLSTTKGCEMEPVVFTNNTAAKGTFTWSFGDGSTSTSINPTHVYSQPGSYIIKLNVVSTYGCSLDNDVQTVLKVYEKPVVNFSADDVDDCYPHTVNFTNTSYLGQKYLWDFGDNTSSKLSDPKHTYYKAGVYDVKLSVTSANDCTVDTTIQSMIFVHNEARPVADFTYNPNPINIYDTEISFKDLSHSKISTWDWNYAVDGINQNSNTQNLWVKFPDNEGGVYPVKLKVSNHLECEDSITKNIVVFDFSTLFIPNAFTPNGDGVNDVLYIGHHHLNYFQIIIFNRWGEEIFRTNDPNDLWDGKVNGTKVQDDVYIYKVDWKGERDGRIVVDSKIGTVTVIR